MKDHHYTINLKWTGNKGIGTLNYKAYTRDHTISTEGKEVRIPVSSDPSFLGDKTRYNPEELLVVASLSSCHMLWYLHLCAVNKIIVTDYNDDATGTMEELSDGSGRFKEVILNPVVSVESVESERMIEKATTLHSEAHKMCFIANSINFTVNHNPQTIL